MTGQTDEISETGMLKPRLTCVTDALVTDYNDALSERESGHAENVALTQELEVLFDTVDALLTCFLSREKFAFA
jgi:hypothetical protein